MGGFEVPLGGASSVPADGLDVEDGERQTAAKAPRARKSALSCG